MARLALQVQRVTLDPPERWEQKVTLEQRALRAIPVPLAGKEFREFKVCRE